MVKNPDQVIDLIPKFCNNCGSSIEAIVISELKARQIVGITVPKAIFTEYRSYAKVCNCGCRSRANFPEGVSSPVSYDTRVESLISYFYARQYLPFARMKDMFNDVFDYKISERELHYLLERFSRKTDPIYQQIKEHVATSEVVGVDETGANICGSKHWFWTWQNKELTYIAHSRDRGSATIKKEFPNGLPNCIIVLDGWRAQAGTAASHHQMCIAHLQQRLNYFNEKYTTAQWGIEFYKLIEDALKLGKEERTTAIYNIKRIGIVHKLDQILKNPPDKNQKELYAFFKSMGRERQHLFNFLFIENLPLDNNGSERAVRNIKVKQKISGQFKVEKSAKNFAQIRSVIDTMIKNGRNVLEGLSLVAAISRDYDFVD